MKQDQMLILGIVMLVIFMVMMPTHKQRVQSYNGPPHQMTKAELQNIKTTYTGAIGHGCYTNQDVVAMHAAIEKARCYPK
tara:strand:+ start:158 stop:397 length:240 start_codon:yes stop_codon:yes gene_type:complete